MTRSAQWLAAGLILGTLACGGNSTEPTADGTTIFLTTTLSFSPADLTVAPGTTVTWVARTSTFHTVTPSNPQQPGVWQRATSNHARPVVSHTFTVAGQDYQYFCEAHIGMFGVVRVR